MLRLAFRLYNWVVIKKNRVKDSILKGECTKCNSKKASHGMRTCEPCRLQARENMRKKRLRLRSEGSKCLRCGCKTEPNVWKCARCTRNVNELPPMTESCYLCGESFDGRMTAVDHVVPVSRGGSHEVENLKWAHHECNNLKAAMILSDFVELCSRIAKQHQ